MFLAYPGIDVTSTDLHKRTALHSSVVSGNLDVVKLILSRTVLSVQDGNDQGATALHEAAGKGFTAIVKYLIEDAGADVLLPVRNPTKGATAVATMLRSAPQADVQVLPLDLSSLGSIAAFATRLLDEGRRLRVG